MKACFFARVDDPNLLDVVEFYSNDIRALRDLGFDVVTATTFSQIPRRADLYYTWWWGSGILSLMKSLPARRPNIFTGALQLAPGIDWWKNLGMVKRGVVRACLKLASANLAICEPELGYLERLGAVRRHLVYPAIDIHLYQPPQPSRQREPLVVTVSHLTTDNIFRKRVETVVRAVPHVLSRRPDARFAIVGGHGNGYAKLVALATDLGVKDAIEFPGRIAVNEKIALYHKASVYAQPTLYEGFGVAIAEAMACGLPVVTSPRGAVPEVVGECARFVEPDDHEGLAREILATLDDPVAAERMSELGRARIVTNFSYETRRKGLANIIREVLPGWSSPITE